MLTIPGKTGAQFCDGVSRRDFLKIGGLALGGLSLPQILAAEAQAGIRSSHKAVIMVFLAGGPPHQDMFDLKMDAPSEIRGEFKPIHTNLPGFEICELMPRLAQMMDKCAVIRSLVGARDEHTSHICYSGYTEFETRQGQHPALGSVLSDLEGPVDPTVPPFVCLSGKMGHAPWAHPGESGFLGRSHAPVQPHGEVMQDMVLKGIPLSRLRDRQRLLDTVDGFRREVDRNMDGLSEINQRAFEILTSRKFAEALDVEKEDPLTRDLYGRGTSKNVDDGGPMWNDQFVVARRLVEAGVRCVTLGYGRWDYHHRNFPQCRERLPMLDQAVSALIQDIHNRGMDQDVSVVVWGEFGRTPRINGDGGRDHWPQVSCGLLAGGGMRTGQVIGSTNPLGEVPDERPVHYKEVFATLYRNLGINPETTPLHDNFNRPRYVVEGYGPLPELI
jgi:hypothetical protein